MAAVWATSSLYQHTSIGDKRNLLVRWQLLFQQNISYQYSVTTDTSPTVDRYTSDCWSQHIDRGVGRVSTDISTDSVDRQSINSNNMSIDTRPTYRPSIGRYIGRDMSAESIDRYSVDRCLKYTWSWTLSRRNLGNLRRLKQNWQKNIATSGDFRRLKAILGNLRRLKVAQTVSSTKILMSCYSHSLSLAATIMVSKNCPTIGGHVVVLFIT